MRWGIKTEQITTSVIRYSLLESGVVLSVQQVFQHWSASSEFCIFFAEVLRASPFNCYRWETPALTKASLDKVFEFVLVDSPHLDVQPSTADFSGHFNRANNLRVIVFENLGCNALLVVPCPLQNHTDYAHLAAFTRSAPEYQQIQLWQQVAKTMRDRLGEKPVWLNTAGGGVPWLHVRLDDTPKYYAYRDYKVLAEH